MDDLKTQAKALNIDLDNLIKSALERAESMFKLGHVKEAEIVIDQLLRVDLNNVSALQLKGLILYKYQNYKEAIEILNKAIKFEPQNAESYNNIALCYLHGGDPESALEHVKKAIALKADCNFINNMGLIFRSMEKLDDAIECFNKAIAAGSPQARANLGSVFGYQKKLDQAINCFKQAIEDNPEDLAAHVDLAYAYHLQGDWLKAWPEYEYRLEYWHKQGRAAARFYELYKSERRWHGETITDKKLAVYCEQGSGDFIQFIRFVPQIKAKEIIIHCPPELADLFADFGIVKTVYDDSYDLHCSILSLPYLLNIKDFAKDKPYFNVDFNPKDFDNYKNYFKIGIVWGGNPGHPNDANRSVYLKDMVEKIGLNNPKIKLFSLQKELGKRVYAVNNAEIDLTQGFEELGVPVVDLSPLMDNFKTTASLIQQMDLIISVDTSVLHLAGGLGKSAIGLIPFNPDWRWGLEGEDNAWYSSIKLARQTERNWNGAFEKAKKLCKLFIE